LKSTIYEFAVIGAGLTGSAAAKYLSKKYKNVVLIGPDEPKDKQNHDGIYGSHYDEGRITRVSDSYFGWSYLAAKSIENYVDIQNQSGIEFYSEVGTLSIGTQDYYNELISTYSKVPFEYKNHENFSLNEDLSKFHFPDNSKFILEQKNAGHVSPRKLVSAQKQIFNNHNGDYVDDFVISINKSNNTFTIRTKTNLEIKSNKILICAGGFTNFTNLLKNDLPTKIRGRTIVLGEVKTQLIDELKKYPSFIHKPDQTNNNREYTYCLPAITYPNGKTYIKIGGSKHYEDINSYQMAIDWFKGKINSKEIEAITNELNLIYNSNTFNNYHTDTCVTTWTKTIYPIIDEIENNLYVSVGGNGSAAKSSDYIGYISALYFAEQRWDCNLNRDLFTLSSNEI
tara:strand:+ start:123 stop:1313 length:1191 start_codon:yes stop_codon:yes gene_type:complete